MTRTDFKRVLEYIRSKADHFITMKHIGRDTDPIDVEADTQRLVNNGLRHCKVRATPKQKFELDLEIRTHLIFWKKEYAI